MTIYPGPAPKTIDSNWPDHTYDQVVCLLNGEYKKKITQPYLKSLGSDRQSYLDHFPNAPMMCLESVAKNSLVTDNRKKARSENLSRLNADDNFNLLKAKGSSAFWSSINDDIDHRRENLRLNAIKQHEEGLMDHIRQVYWNSKYQGSKEQELRSIRMSGDRNPAKRPEVKEKIRQSNLNRKPSFKQKKWNNTDLRYQSSYELDFLDFMERSQFAIDRILNGPILSQEGMLYISDFIIDDTYIIEIKSWYIEQLQEQNKPGSLKMKEELVKQAGYQWLYIKDKDYSQLQRLFNL